MSVKGIDVRNTKTGTMSYGIEVKDAQDDTADTRKITLRGVLWIRSTVEMLRKMRFARK